MPINLSPDNQTINPTKGCKGVRFRTIKLTLLEHFMQQMRNNLMLAVE